MEFTNLQIKKLHETELGEIYEGLTHNFYELKEISFSKEEEKLAIFLEKLIQRKASLSQLNDFNLGENFSIEFRNKIISIIELNSLLEKLPSKKVFAQLLSNLIFLISKIDFISNKAFFSEKVLHESIGLKQLAFFSMDKDFEELMVNGLNEIFVFHKRFGMCKVNIVLKEKVFENILQRIAYTLGKEFNSSNSLLDARLPDGSRVNATFNSVSPNGKTLTIRKFSNISLSIIDLIKNETITSEAAAFLWLMVEGFGVNPKNILIIGGTASGKTTFLTVLSNFIRFNNRVVSIEDTLELALFNRPNWVALEATHSKNETVVMDDLLKNSLRMRPDRLIVGEVRGKEANTLFTAMDNGHEGCLGTIHANNPKELIIKLQGKPFDVPKTMLPLVDLIVSINRKYSKENGINRKVVQISEVSRMEDKVLLGNVYETKNNNLVRSDVPSFIIEKFSEEVSMSKNDVKKEIEKRKIILDWLINQNISKPMEILEFIQSYYFDPEKVLSLVYK